MRTCRRFGSVTARDRKNSRPALRIKPGGKGYFSWETVVK